MAESGPPALSQEETRKRGLAPSPDDGWRDVNRKRRRGHRQQQQQQPTRQQAVQRRQQEKRSPEVVRPTEWRLDGHEEASSYSAIVAMEASHPGFKIAVRLSRGGDYFLSGRDEASAERLRLLAEGTLPSSFVLTPARRESHGVLTRFPAHYPLHVVTSHPAVLKAVRCEVRLAHGRKEPTRQVELRLRGPLPPSLDLGSWGVFSVRPFHREPLRCYRCHAFGHHQRTCEFKKELCGVCSGGHPTSQCLTALREGGPRPKAQCPNCYGSHHVWNKQCPERLRRIPGSAPKPSAPEPQPQKRKRRKRRTRRRKPAAPQQPAEPATPRSREAIDIEPPQQPITERPAPRPADPAEPANQQPPSPAPAQPSPTAPPHVEVTSPPAPADAERSIKVSEMERILTDFRQLIMQEFDYLKKGVPCNSAVDVALDFLEAGQPLPMLLNGVEDDGYILDAEDINNALDDEFGSLSEDDDYIQP